MLVRYEVVFPPIPCVGPVPAETFWRAPGACREPRTAHSPGRTCSRWICRWLKGDNKHKQRHVCVICKWRPPSKLWVERSRTRVCGLPRLTFRCISWSSIVLLFYLIAFLFGFPNLLKNNGIAQFVAVPMLCATLIVFRVEISTVTKVPPWKPDGSTNELAIPTCLSSFGLNQRFVKQLTTFGTSLHHLCSKCTTKKSFCGI